MCQEKYTNTKDLENNKKIVDFILKYAKENIAMVRLFVRDPYYTSIKRDVEMTLSSFLGNAGGLVGLFMGFSLISLIEGFYHFINLFINCCSGCKYKKSHVSASTNLSMC